MTSTLKILAAAAACVVPFLLMTASAQEQGASRPASDAGAVTVWDSRADQWIDIETFWQRYADRRGGLSWPASRDYPEYDQVKELDTFWVLLDEGPCLMQFYHGRWRRANDVQRWDDAFNDFGGCPFVFR